MYNSYGVYYTVYTTQCILHSVYYTIYTAIKLVYIGNSIKNII